MATSQNPLLLAQENRKLLVKRLWPKGSNPQTKNACFWKLLKKTFFSTNILNKIWIFFKNLWPYFQKRFCPKIFLMFSVLSFRMEHKKAIENLTPVYFCLHHEFYIFFVHFWAFLRLCDLVSNIFTFFQGFRSMSWKMWFIQ